MATIIPYTNLEKLILADLKVRKVGLHGARESVERQAAQMGVSWRELYRFVKTERAGTGVRQRFLRYLMKQELSACLRAYRLAEQLEPSALAEQIGIALKEYLAMEHDQPVLSTTVQGLVLWAMGEPEKV